MSLETIQIKTLKKTKSENTDLAIILMEDEYKYNRNNDLKESVAFYTYFIPLF
jgi:hypothetical protein